MASCVELAASVPSAVVVHTLTEDDVADLRLGWTARLQPEEVRQLLAVHPGRSVWTPRTLEYAIVGPWRHRPEIAHLIELSAVRHSEEVIAAVVERCQDAEDELLVSVELDEVRRPTFYQRIGFELLEEIVTYEWSGRTSVRPPPLGVRFQPVDPMEDGWRQVLLDVDHAAFPWLWRNSDFEFQTYGVTPGVEVYLGWLDDQPISYLGLTFFPGWGHLDRIAVHPDYQGTGVGQAALAFAVQQMLRRGARRVALSTQRNNIRSQHLYERFGFRRMPTNDYRLYGRFMHESD